MRVFLDLMFDGPEFLEIDVMLLAKDVLGPHIPPQRIHQFVNLGGPRQQPRALLLRKTLDVHADGFASQLRAPIQRIQDVRM